MDQRHRHAGAAQQNRQRQPAGDEIVRQAGRTFIRQHRGAAGRNRRVAQQQGQRQQQHEDGDALRRQRPAPARRLDQERADERHRPLPQRLPGCRNADGKARPLHEPVADQRRQRRRQRTAAKRTGQEEQHIELPQRLRLRGRQHRQPGDDHSCNRHLAHADPLRHVTEHQAAERDAEQADGVDQRDVAALPAVFGLQRHQIDRQPVDQLPHHHAENGGARQQDHPAIGRFLCG